MPVKKQSVSMPDPHWDRLKNRAGEDAPISAQIAEDLSLCWGLLDRGLATARAKLTQPEAKLLLDVQNGTLWDAYQLPLWLHGGLMHQVSDGLVLDNLDEKWEIDGPALLTKIGAMTELETIALLDWCRWMWRHCDTAGHWDTELAKFQEGAKK